MRLPIFSSPLASRKLPLNLYDIPVTIALFALIGALVSAGRGMTQDLIPEKLVIHLDYSYLPYYALMSIVRMFIAFAWTLLFTFAYGSLAAHSPRAEKVLMPLLDVLQSVPVLGFLSVTLTSFMALFPGSTLGLEFASIFAIFTSQAWNMAYSFFQSVRSIPRDLLDAAKVFRLTPFQRFIRIEVPFALNGLVWNAMVSFGNGWFFLTASEAITVLNRDLRLPGIGSYLATAVEAEDFTAIGAAIFTMVLIILGLDLFFFRPLLAWSRKFGPQTSLDEGVESAVLTALQRSHVVTAFASKVIQPLSSLLVNRLPAALASRGGKTPPTLRRALGITLATIILLWLGLYVAKALINLQVTTTDVTKILERIPGYFVDGVYTLLRVFACVALASALWVPVGIFIGLRRGLARKVRPLIQLGAAFPANLAYPLLTWFFLHTGTDLGIGSVLLMLLGSQWYILFNVIVGALAIPEDLKEVGMVFKMNWWQKFRHIVMPVVFPYWVTGAITAAGGAWNASIVAEVTRLGDTVLACRGLGASMTEATQKGDWPGIVLTIIIMSAFVIVTNRLFWRRLYDYAEERFRLEH